MKRNFLATLAIGALLSGAAFAGNQASMDTDHYTGDPASVQAQARLNTQTTATTTTNSWERNNGAWQQKQTEETRRYGIDPNYARREPIQPPSYSSQFQQERCNNFVSNGKQQTYQGCL